MMQLKYQNVLDNTLCRRKVLKNALDSSFNVVRMLIQSKSNLMKNITYLFNSFSSWSCQASAELRLISQKQGILNFTRKTNHIYTAKENDWGYSCFMTWSVSIVIFRTKFNYFYFRTFSTKIKDTY